MPTNAHLTASAEIPASTARVWRVLTDYRVHHPAILPQDVFRKLEVLKGGTGAGTRFRLEMRVGGKTNVSEMVASEPEPGSVLMEATDDRSVVTTFTLAPADAGRATLLTIATDYTLPAGIFLPLQRWITNNVLGGLYRRELENLRAYVRADRDLKGSE
jgi:hypothetical protein